MNIIVNVDKNWAIGNDGALLFPLSADLQHFKRLTIHKTVIMGRATLESLPNGAPLKERRNIVLSTTLPPSPLPQHGQQPQQTRGADGNAFYVCNSLTHLESLLNSPAFAAVPRDEIFVIGGAHVYAELLPRCKTAYVTKTERAAPRADAFFPNLDALPDWRIATESDIMYEAQTAFRFLRYERT